MGSGGFASRSRRHMLNFQLRRGNMHPQSTPLVIADVIDFKSLLFCHADSYFDLLNVVILRLDAVSSVHESIT